jgi:hypothetical protein
VKPVGSPPKDLGLIDLSPSEMMFWMYLPISVPGDHSFHLPDNLRHFIPIIRGARWDDPERFLDNYVYLTAKTLWVEGGYIGNRPGWHIDGYGTDDLNYIWPDRAPTVFLIQQNRWMLSEDCDESLKQMAKIGRYAEAFDHAGLRTYPDKHLLRLDNTVLHRSPTGFESGMRTFVKVSLSSDRYNLKGNSVNHLLPETHWPLVDRQEVRNHPAFKNSDFIKD